MIKVFVVEDHAVVRKGIISVLQQQDGLAVLGEAEDGITALRSLHNGLQPDVLLTDLNMPGMDGIQLVRRITDQKINLPCIILTMHNSAEFLEKAQAAGARGYLLKNGDMQELIACIKDVHNGLLVVGKEFR